MINLDYRLWDIPSGSDGPLFEQVKNARCDAADEELIDPLRLKDIDIATKTIWQAIEENERIVVFGDYDVDGVTATAIMMNYLEGIGADVYYKLPNRVEDGYGISPDAVEMLSEKGVSLIITVDNGISALDAAKCAAEKGITLVITDHHEPADELPAAAAIVNPKQKDDNSGYETLSGAGVALCLVAAMEGCSANDVFYDFSEFAALGTVCDVMPLNKLNRTIVRAGLSVMNENPSTGIAAILTTAKQQREVDSNTLGFTIGPRINSAGRMEDPVAALSLLLSTDDEEAYHLAQQLEQCNEDRRSQELALIEQLTIEAEKQARDPVLVLFGDNHHEGVIGLAAARLMRSCAKPCIVISLNGDIGKGSGRSMPWFSLYDALSVCSAHLLGFGGHTLAAGFSIARESCEAFRMAINDYAKKIMLNAAIDSIVSDGVIVNRITLEDIASLQDFAPFGQANPKPNFTIKDVSVEKITAMKEQHCRICFTHLGERYWVSCFGRTPQSLGYAVGDRVDMVVELSIYSGGANKSISMLLKHIRPAGMADDVVHNIKLFAKYYYGCELSSQQRAALYPDREFTAKVFRSLQDVSAIDTAGLICRFNSQDSGRVLAALFGLHELGLIYEKNGVLNRTDNPQKRSLDESSVIRGLAI